MYQLLKTFRFISIVGSLVSILLLILNLLTMFIFNHWSNSLNNSWKIFFITIIFTLFSSIMGYLLHEKIIKTKRLSR